MNPSRDQGAGRPAQTAPHGTKHFQALTTPRLLFDGFPVLICRVNLYSVKTLSAQAVSLNVTFQITPRRRVCTLQALSP